MILLPGTHNPSNLRTSPTMASMIQFDEDRLLTIGLSTHPSTPGHTLAVLKSGGVNLFSLPAPDFIQALTKISTTASRLCQFTSAQRCALVTEGGSSLSLLPLHGPKVNEPWHPVTMENAGALVSNELHERGYAGYISSKDGPFMAAEKLSAICSRIRAVSGLSSPSPPPYNNSNNRFDGPVADRNDHLFARIVRSEQYHWRVWEDNHHVAFLFPFANTPGITILVPRARFAGDVFSSVKGDAFSALMTATHHVGNMLNRAFGNARCGMIIEGFQDDYAHVKLVPIHHHDDPSVQVSTNNAGPFNLEYQGFVTSLPGPRYYNMWALQQAANGLAAMFEMIEEP
ncbi:hypothetical protein QBC43DRAFT_371564 [Cladorrhinum sp. PSN259]|nr:hypothetical protein QBC43DRAFT_371564 [Cladorrhinum sp. PSN259]